MAQVKNSYETVMLISNTLGDEGIAAMVERFKGIIEQNATIDNIDEWGKRRLAYPSDPTFPAELDRLYKITDGVLRTLIIKKEA